MHLFPQTILKEEISIQAECPSSTCSGPEVCKPLKYVHSIPPPARNPELSSVYPADKLVIYYCSDLHTTCKRHLGEIASKSKQKTHVFHIHFIYALSLILGSMSSPPELGQFVKRSRVEFSIYGIVSGLGKPST